MVPYIMRAKLDEILTFAMSRSFQSSSGVMLHHLLNEIWKTWGTGIVGFIGLASI